MTPAEKVVLYLCQYGLEKRIKTLDKSSETVALAANALGCEAALIAKTLSFEINGNAVLIVTAGDAKVENKKFKDFFGIKAKMLSPEQVEKLTGFIPGGVCPFAAKEGVKIYLDKSLQRFKTVYPAGGSGNTAVELSPSELEYASQAESWIDVCKGWQDEK